ncbi:MAG: DsbA family oxidoreductase [Hyphomicrobiales bacterium]|nr:DsbA family oxidoreductase [Rhodoblastus sp.]MCC0000761.1 DsbA family oxidoreductase [Methylobacteriaceae bacterium]MCC2100411.1 DsbA family oxidoreductase [Hyphomicrobiales bacterium]MCB1524500.1 DsbA family oxidoreductase [Rhodoblastus sp.]MCC0002906.1 DsbA family oxidoreductase [Methylobacteriaceae bacterium]
MTEPQRRSIAIDVVSDAVCPWCYIGKRNLEAALADLPELDVEVRWRPYQLDATIPPEGIDRKAYLQRKFGARVDEIYNRVKEAGATAGIPFAFEDIERSPNTLDAHRLIRWAASAGAQDAIVERLFRDFFIEGKDIGDREVLLAAARDCGLDPAIVADLLAGEADKESVREEIASAQHIGVTGVPFFILDGKFALPGAQPPDVLKRAIAKVLEKSGEARA